MSLSESAISRLAGLWGGYEHRLIRDKYFATSSDLVERFLENYEAMWGSSRIEADQELRSNLITVRALLREWAQKKLEQMLLSESVDVLRSPILFKQLHYGQGETLNFGSDGVNWRKKSAIAEELGRYRPWSVAHAAASVGSVQRLYRHLHAIVARSKSPSELRFFEEWWRSTDATDRPLLVPQVHGHTSGKFWLEIARFKSIPLHFDFGLVNVVRQTKTVIEIDSRRYHSNAPEYQADRDRQNVASELGWAVRRYTYQDVTDRLEWCFGNLHRDLKY